MKLIKFNVYKFTSIFFLIEKLKADPTSYEYLSTIDIFRGFRELRISFTAVLAK